MNQRLPHGNTVNTHFGNVDQECTFCKFKHVANLESALARQPTQVEKGAGRNDSTHNAGMCIVAMATISKRKRNKASILPFFLYRNKTISPIYESSKSKRNIKGSL